MSDGPPPWGGLRRRPGACEGILGHTFEWWAEGFAWRCTHCGHVETRQERSRAAAWVAAHAPLEPEPPTPPAPVRLHTRPPDPDVVRLLKDMAAQAEAGDLQGFTLVGVRPGGATVHVRAFSTGAISQAQLLGALYAEAQALAQRYAEGLTVEE